MVLSPRFVGLGEFVFVHMSVCVHTLLTFSSAQRAGGGLALVCVTLADLAAYAEWGWAKVAEVCLFKLFMQLSCFDSLAGSYLAYLGSVGWELFLRVFQGHGVLSGGDLTKYDAWGFEKIQADLDIGCRALRRMLIQFMLNS